MKLRLYGDGKNSYYLDHRKIKSLKRKYKGVKYLEEVLKQGKMVEK